MDQTTTVSRRSAAASAPIGASGGRPKAQNSSASTSRSPSASANGCHPEGLARNYSCGTGEPRAVSGVQEERDHDDQPQQRGGQRPHLGVWRAAKGPEQQRQQQHEPQRQRKRVPAGSDREELVAPDGITQAFECGLAVVVGGLL